MILMKTFDKAMDLFLFQSPYVHANNSTDIASGSISALARLSLLAQRRYHVRALKDLMSPSVIIKIVEDVHAVSEDYVEVLEPALKKVNRFSGSVEDSDLVSGSFSTSSIPFEPSEIGVSSSNPSFEGSGCNTAFPDTFDSCKYDEKKKMTKKRFFVLNEISPHFCP
jgi:hypothetical protein